MLAKFESIRQQFEMFARDYFYQQRIPSERLQSAMAYSFLDGGKRIRAILSYLSADCFGCHTDNKHYIAFALEAMHAYSLIHDDLPAMDDDALRRGKPTCHIQYNEATAILAADALQSIAFQALSELKEINIDQLKNILFVLATHTGAKGMVAGQQLDIDAEGNTQTIKTLETIHKLKTGKLLTASVVLPFLASSYYLDKHIEQHLIKFSECIGLAFQVKDDLLEATSDTKILGKSNMSDLKLNKSTYPSLLGIEKTKMLLYTLIKEAYLHLDRLSQFNTENLKQLAEYIIKREY